MLFTLPPDFSLPLLAFIVITVGAGYTMFGAIGFGSSIISVPILAHALPLPFLIPMITAVDCFAGTTAVTRQWRHVRWHEVRLLLLPILIGVALGLTLLIHLPRNAALGALGVAVGAYALYTLFGMRQWQAIKSVWAIPLGLVGGAFSALFGTGGPIYMVFLASRIDDKTELRATSSLLIALVVAIRALAFVITGLWIQQGILLVVALLLPVMLAGYALGSRLHNRLSGKAVRRGVAFMLLGNSVLLVARALEALP